MLSFVLLDHAELSHQGEFVGDAPVLPDTAVTNPLDLHLTNVDLAPRGLYFRAGRRPSRGSGRSPRCFHPPDC
jgi:hypothetical protein